jgi:hypothetical protein
MTWVNGLPSVPFVLCRRVLERKGWKVEDKIQDRLLKKVEP